MSDASNGSSGGPPLSRRDMMRILGLGTGLVLVPLGPLAMESSAEEKKDKPPDYDWTKHYWGYAIDTTKCIGCLACMRGCRAENDVPATYARTWVERYTIGTDGQVRVDVAKDENAGFFPLPGGEANLGAGLAGAKAATSTTLVGEQPDEGDVAKAFFVPKICNHCEKSVCTQVCPVGASYRTLDGVVLVDTKRCIGCGYCVQACPYATRFINPKTHMADKCTFCYHRITKGKKPACVQACPRSARVYGDLKDPSSELSILLKQRRYRVLRPEMGTDPKCYYIGLDREVI